MAPRCALESFVYENKLMPAPRKTTDILEFALQLGHQFKQPALLQEALTHPSLAGKQRKKGPTAYERLEFLGDRVLGLIIAEWLYKKYPDSSEGDLAKRHAALVNREALRAIAVEINLGRYLYLARGEDASADRKNLATLPDAMEAVLGALYLDGGLQAACDFIHRFWQKDIAIEEAPADPKTLLQEWAQGQGLPLPAYKVIEHSGPAHAPKFIVEVLVKDFPPAVAEGNSKRAAQKAAAELWLKNLPPKSH